MPTDLIDYGGIGCDMMPVTALAGDAYYELTPIGDAFIRVCRPPKPTIPWTNTCFNVTS